MSIQNPSQRDPSRWFITFAYVLAGLLLILLFGALFFKRHPTIGPDEFGYLINGQHLVNHSEIPLLENMRSFYMVGYGFVTALAALIGGSLKAEFTLSLAFNIGFVVLTGMVLNAFAQRHLMVSRAWSRIVAIAACLMPTLAANALFSWSEPLARLGFALVVLLVFEYAKRATIWAGVSLAILMAWMPVVHGRFTLVLPLVALVFVASGCSGKAQQRIVSAVSMATLALAYLLMRAANLWLQGELYPSAGGKEGRIIRKIIDPSNYRGMLRGLFSQVWYVAATSMGIAILGTIVFVVMSREGVQRRSLSQSMAPIFTLVAMLVIVLTNTLQLIKVVRPDHLAYGRYPEVVTPVLLVAGFSFFLRGKEFAQRWWWSGCWGTVALSALLLVGSGGDNIRIRMARGEFFEIGNSIGLDVPKHLLAPMGYISVTAFFLVFGVAITGLFRYKREAGMALFMVVSLACTTYTVTKSIVPRRNDATHLTLDNKIRSMAKDSSDTVIGLDSRQTDWQDFFDYRFVLHPILIKVANFEEFVPTDIKCAITNQALPPGPDWVMVDVEEGWGLALWKRVGVDSC
jgi:hypothetical protein